jgi:hypothetical protein
MSPQELVEAAALLLSERVSPTLGVWSRAVALLARQSIEQSLNLLWRARAPGLEACSTHAQLLCLPLYLRDVELAQSSSYAWMALTRVCHHHPYELLPNNGELTALIDIARRLAAKTSNVTVDAIDREVVTRQDAVGRRHRGLQSK